MVSWFEVSGDFFDYFNYRLEIPPKLLHFRRKEHPQGDAHVRATGCV
jgi:hypothetical protein